MISKGFSIGEVIKTGWRAFKEHILFFIILFIFVAFLHAIPSFFDSQDPDQSPNLLIVLLAVIINLIVKTGWINVSLRASDRQSLQFKDFFVNWRSILNFLVASILFFLLISVGLFLFVIPGIYWATKYGLYGYFIIDKKAGPLEAFQLSGQTTYGAKWDLLGLILVLILLNVLGLLALVIGLVITIPVSSIAEAAAYRKLLAQRTEESPVVQPTIMT